MCAHGTWDGMDRSRSLTNRGLRAVRRHRLGVFTGRSGSAITGASRATMPVRSSSKACGGEGHYLLLKNFRALSCEIGTPWKHGPASGFPYWYEGEPVRVIVCVKNPYAWLDPPGLPRGVSGYSATRRSHPTLSRSPGRGRRGASRSPAATRAQEPGDALSS
jgi:hypothetical protein